MHQIALNLPANARIELWARARGNGIDSFCIQCGSETVYHIPALPSYFDFFHYNHREASEVTLSWDPMQIEVSYAYSYDPSTVATHGITLWEFVPEGLILRTGHAIHAWMAEDLMRPKLHFSPPRMWMNDPNGLCKISNTWHLFYQFHPNSVDWGPMYWGHAISQDLFHWTHQPVFLHPEQNLARLDATGGAFSGTALCSPNQQVAFYYTERYPAYDHFKGYREVQKRAQASRDLVRVTNIETVISTRPPGVEHDFRDPKVWWEEQVGQYRMILGASLFDDPAVLLYGSPDGKDWDYLGPLYVAPTHFRKNKARSVECPDFFQLDGRWVLVMGFLGYAEPETGRRHLLYALIGEFDGHHFRPTGSNLQLLDFGADFYAMQSFEADGRRIAHAWLFNWETRRPGPSQYSGELALPRELEIDEKGRLCMLPVIELEQTAAFISQSGADSGTYCLPDTPFAISLSGKIEGTTILATQAGKPSFNIIIQGGLISIVLSQDDGKKKYTARALDPRDLTIVHDRGIIEIFVDRGAICGTRRNYTNVKPDEIRIDSAADRNLSLIELNNLSCETNATMAG